MKKIGKKEIILLVVAIIVFLSALGFFCYREIPELLKPKVYYRTYTKEKGWSRWSKNGKTSGNGYDITAIQIKLKGKETISYNTSIDGLKFKKSEVKNNEVSGDKKTPIKSIYIKTSNKFPKKYKIVYRLTSKKEKWENFIDNNLKAYSYPIKEKYSPIRYVQINVEERK